MSSHFQGSIQANEAALNGLFHAIANELASEQTKLALWLMLNQLDLSAFSPQPIGPDSPFPSSGSVLGRGLLINLKSNIVDQLVRRLAMSGHLNFEVLHLEIEKDGIVQFASYDHFEHVLFGDNVGIDLLKNLQAQQIIVGYQLFGEFA